MRLRQANKILARMRRGRNQRYTIPQIGGAIARTGLRDRRYTRLWAHKTPLYLPHTLFICGKPAMTLWLAPKAQT